MLRGGETSKERVLTCITACVVEGHICPNCYHFKGEIRKNGQGQRPREMESRYAPLFIE